jgi:hypothetical protein
MPVGIADLFIRMVGMKADRLSWAAQSFHIIDASDISALVPAAGRLVHRQVGTAPAKPDATAPP